MRRSGPPARPAPPSRGTGHDTRDIERVGALYPEHGTAVARRERHPGRQVEVERVAQRFPPPSKRRVEAARERVVMSEPDEMRHRTLVVARRVPDHQRAQLACLGDQFRRRDDVAEPESGREQLRERRDVDDAVLAIHAAQGGMRVALVVALAVEVVLDHEHVALRRLLEQRPAARQRHRDTGRRLVTRRHVYDPATVERAVDEQSIPVDGLVDDRGAATIQQVTHRRIPRLLDRDRHAGIDEQFGHQVERLLGADRDEYFVRASRYPAHRQDLGPQFLDEHRVVLPAAGADQASMSPLASA